MGTTFLHAHAAHADGLQALARVNDELRSAASKHARFQPTLGFLYFSDHHAARAESMLDALRSAWPGMAVAGGVGIGVAASGVEYFDEPGLALMLCDLPRTSFTLFHGRAPLTRDDAWAALVHADPSTHDLAALITELSERLPSGYLFGGLASSRSAHADAGRRRVRRRLVRCRIRPRRAAAVARHARLPAAVQAAASHRRGGQPRADARRRTGAAAVAGRTRRRISATCPRCVAALRRTLVGLTDEGDEALARGGQFGADTRVRHLIGLDPARQGIAVADLVEPGAQLAFCTRDVEAARRDLVRVCSELREEAESGGAATAGEPRRIAGAIYVSCTGRGGAHFGAPSAELQTVRRALGDVPLVGFYAAGEIARHHLYGYTGVLTAFLD